MILVTYTADTLRTCLLGTTPQRIRSSTTVVWHDASGWTNIDVGRNPT